MLNHISYLGKDTGAGEITVSNRFSLYNVSFIGLICLTVSYDGLKYIHFKTGRQKLIFGTLY